jgi:tetratricopeptide (TPR) repeat protein
MDKESKSLVRLLEKAEVEEAFKHADSMRDKKEASSILNDFSISLIRNLSDYDAAEQLLRKAVALNPANPEAYFNLGALYTEPSVLIRDESKILDAENSYKKAIKTKPDYMEAHYNLALLYHFSGRHDEAEIEYAVFSELCDDKELLDGLKKILERKVRRLEMKDLSALLQ